MDPYNPLHLIQFRTGLAEAVRSITLRGVALVGENPQRFESFAGQPFTSYLPELALDVQTPAFQRLLPLTVQAFGPQDGDESLELARLQFWQCIREADPSPVWQRRFEDTTAHSLRVARNSVAIGSELGWAPGRLLNLYWGALFHDVGKVFVDELEPALVERGYPFAAILPLIRTHAALGSLLMGCVRPLFPMGEICASQHQESVDGSGYPLGLTYPQISAEGMLVNLGDGYDATVTRTNWSDEQVCDLEQDTFRQAGYPDAPELNAFLSVVRQNHTAWYGMR